MRCDQDGLVLTCGVVLLFKKKSVREGGCGSELWRVHLSTTPTTADGRKKNLFCVTQAVSWVGGWVDGWIERIRQTGRHEFPSLSRHAIDGAVVSCAVLCCSVLSSQSVGQSVRTPNKPQRASASHPHTDSPVRALPTPRSPTKPHPRLCSPHGQHQAGRQAAIHSPSIHQFIHPSIQTPMREGGREGGKQDRMTVHTTHTTPDDERGAVHRLSLPV
mmetsp:Transcript_4807/g.12957  ORF Transcript_4807/g.12957 Transcript_4807/m.12957 type:complete len:217 (-) Transcript_4807:1492-2142(-)